METNKVTELRTEEAWKQALTSWNHPSIPYVIAPKTKDELDNLGEIGHILRDELAFMQLPTFQTYVNLENILETFPDDAQRGLAAITKHEAGHRFCPYDTITTIILTHAAKQALAGENIPYDATAAAKLVINLFADMAINTAQVRKGDEDIPWAYASLSAKKKAEEKETPLWRVYGKSMETAWKKDILPEATTVSEEETSAALALSNLFERDVLDKSKWRERTQQYAKTLAPFLEEEQQDKGATLDDIAGNMPQQLDERTARELAKRLAEIGSDGLPTNPEGLREFKEIMAGFGQGSPLEASIAFYEMLSRSYDVPFATKPFGRPRVSPFQPVKWQPSMGADALDVGYSVLVGGRVIPGVTTYGWNTRRREIHGGMEEVVPNLDLYLDSSQSMPNPTETISLPVLAGFVAARKAHNKGASIRATNFSGENQHQTQEWTRNLQSIFKNLVTYFNGGTVFPIRELLTSGDPKQALIITDTFLANEDEAAQAVKELRERHSSNGIAIYALHPIANAGYLRNAGADVIHGTTTDIFKRTIGKAHEVYTR